MKPKIIMFEDEILLSRQYPEIFEREGMECITYDKFPEKEEKLIEFVLKIAPDLILTYYL